MRGSQDFKNETLDLGERNPLVIPINLSSAYNQTHHSEFPMFTLRNNLALEQNNEFYVHLVEANLISRSLPLTKFMKLIYLYQVERSDVQ